MKYSITLLLIGLLMFSCSKPKEGKAVVIAHGIPLVHATGGLKDTVREGHNGFLFDQADVPSMTAALSRALQAYSDLDGWEGLQRNGMQADFSWKRSARRYAGLYQALMDGSTDRKNFKPLASQEPRSK